MTTITKERTILQIIKYLPPLFIVILVALATTYMTINHHDNLEKDKAKIQREYLVLNKERIKLNMEVANRYIKRQVQNSQLLLKKELHNKINTAYNIALNIYEKNKNRLSKEEIITLIKYAIEPIRFDNGDGYFSIHTMDGINILQPIQRDFEGKSVLNREDSHGDYPVQKAIKIAKMQGEGYLEWSFYKPNDKSREFQKFGIVKKFEPYDLIITTAVFKEDVQKTLTKHILQHLNNLEYPNKEYVFVFKNNMELLLSNISYNKSIFIDKIEGFINSTEKSAYIEYPYPSDGVKYPKISYLLKVEDMGWTIGTGFNLKKLNNLIQTKQKEVEDEYNSYLQTIYLSAGFIILFVLIISLLISNILRKIFYSYKEQLLEKEALRFTDTIKELNDILNNIPLLFIYKDTKNNILRVNNTFAKMFNFQIEALRNVAVKDLFPLSHEEFYKDDLEIIKTKKSKLGVIESYIFEGREITVESSKIPIFNDEGEVTNIIIFNLDITEKLKQEADKIDNYLQTIISFVDLIEKRDFYTAGHSRRVAKYAVTIAKAMDFTPKDIEMLEQIGLLHDIGKIVIPDSILLKPGRLTEQEYEIIQAHAQIGYDVIKKIPMFQEFAEIILSHHERYDGSGYPNGLKGDEIPRLASILSIADSFDAMTSARIYNKTKTLEQALNELQNDAGTLFDPEIVKIAISVLQDIELQAPLQIKQLPTTPIEKERFSYFFRDSLTNFSNENYLNLLFRENLHHYKCLNLILIHNFAAFNKQNGWQEGNKLIVEIAKIISENYVAADIFRFHGPNFILLNETHIELDITLVNQKIKSHHLHCELHHIEIDTFTTVEKLEEYIEK